jgi:hypothetical protein
VDADEPGADDDDDAMAGDGLGCLTQATRWPGDITPEGASTMSQFVMFFVSANIV